MWPDSTAYVLGLVRRHPELQAMLDEHLEDFDELLSHLFFGDLTRWAQVQATRPPSPALLGVLADLEQAITASADEVQELIAVSFLENLDEESAVWDLLGPELRAEARRMFGDGYPRGHDQL